MNKLLFFVIFCVFFLSNAFSQNVWTSNTLDSIAKRYSVSSIDMFMEMLSIPNDSHYPEMLLENIEWFENIFQKRGFLIKRLETSSVPVLFLERKVSDQKRTVLFYMHGDGQPVQAEYWDQEDPWKPVIKELNNFGKWEKISLDQLKNNFNPEYRIFCRSASDDKGPIAMLLAAIDAIDDAGKKPDFNIKLLIDFEEEIGSYNLMNAVKDNRETLKADMLIILDGPLHISNKPTLFFGARGIASISLTSYGPKVAQHSGHYGNYLPNPAFIMSRLLASMKDQDGRVLIPGFYDGISFTEEEKRIFQKVPDNEEFIHKSMGINKAEKVGNNYQESLQYPSLNIRSMQSGSTGEKVANIIPTECNVDIDLRLVPESKPDELIKLIRKFIEDQNYYVINHSPDDEERLKHANIIKFENKISYEAFRTPIQSEIGIWLNSSLVRAFGSEPVIIRTMGGSLPIAPIIQVLNVPSVIVPTVNADNNQHSHNENLRFGNYKDGIKLLLSIFTEPL